MHQFQRALIPSHSCICLHIEYPLNTHVCTVMPHVHTFSKDLWLELFWVLGNRCIYIMYINSVFYIYMCVCVCSIYECTCCMSGFVVKLFLCSCLFLLVGYGANMSLNLNVWHVYTQTAQNAKPKALAEEQSDDANLDANSASGKGRYTERFLRHLQDGSIGFLRFHLPKRPQTNQNKPKGPCSWAKGKKSPKKQTKVDDDYPSCLWPHQRLPGVHRSVNTIVL